MTATVEGINKQRKDTCLACMLVIFSLTQTMLIEREQSPKIESGVWEGDKARNQ